MELETYIRHIPGFPKEGILFHDITPSLLDGEALRYSVDQLGKFAQGRKTDLVLGAEARGFIMGAALAYSLGVGFATARKAGQAALDCLPVRVRPGIRHGRSGDPFGCHQARTTCSDPR